VDGQTQESLKLPWLMPEALVEFIDELRRNGFNIGLADYIAAQDLLLMLTARGERLENPQRAASLLGPLLCSSPAEQVAFPEYFSRWAERYQTAPREKIESHQETMAEALEDIAKRGLRWQCILIALVVVILGLTTWFISLNFLQAGFQTSTTQTPANQNPVLDMQSDTLRQFVAAIGLLGLTYFAWWAWWRWNANQFLQRRQSTGSPEIRRISLLASDEALFPSLTFLSLARLYRQRTQVASKELNVIRTVEKSVQHGGWLYPIYDHLMIPPEYLVLVDRRSRFDHLAEFMEGMVKGLEIHGVFVTAYAFDGDPRLCFPLHGKEAPQSLNELAARFEDRRLIIFAEGQGLLNSVSGRLAPWARLFNRWAYRSVLTPEPPANWGTTERELQHEFTVLPGTVDGLATFMRIIQGQEKAKEIDIWSDSALPTRLQERPQRWIERDSPPASQIDELLENLDVYLGEEGYTWLKACAVYPQLQWQITITLGQLLKDAQGKSLLRPNLLIDLARLPWFRYGNMPNWLRMRLVLDLSFRQEKEVRTVLEALLVTAVQGHGESLDLEVAYERRDWTSRLARPLLRILHRQNPSESPIHDQVFLDFMLQRPNLAVRVPEALRRRLFGRQISSVRRVSKEKLERTGEIQKRRTIINSIFPIRRDFNNFSYVIIAVAATVNILLGQLAFSLRLSVYLDASATIFVAVSCGPWAGALAGVLSYIIWGLLINPDYLPWWAISLFIGLVTGLCANAGFFKNWWKALITGFIVALTVSITSVPISVYLYGGISASASSSFLTVFLLQTLQGIPQSIFSTSFLPELTDKILSAMLSFAAVKTLSRRVLERFPRPENMETGGGQRELYLAIAIIILVLIFSFFLSAILSY
jgi:ABC-type xylose transport system, permease component